MGLVCLIFMQYREQLEKRISVYVIQTVDYIQK